MCTIRRLLTLQLRVAVSRAAIRVGRSLGRSVPLRQCTEPRSARALSRSDGSSPQAGHRSRRKHGRAVLLKRLRPGQIDPRPYHLWHCGGRGCGRLWPVSGLSAHGRRTRAPLAGPRAPRPHRCGPCGLEAIEHRIRVEIGRQSARVAACQRATAQSRRPVDGGVGRCGSGQGKPGKSEDDDSKRLALVLKHNHGVRVTKADSLLSTRRGAHQSTESETLD
jgi:hypothetical protein